MQLKDWETTIQQMAYESNNAPFESDKDQVLRTWRSNLEKPPTGLQPFQIDQIVREARKRFVVRTSISK